MLDSMYGIFVAVDIYLAIEKAHAMVTYWAYWHHDGGHSTVTVGTVPCT